MHERLGGEPACGIRTSHGTIFVALKDIRFPQVLQEVIEDSVEHSILKSFLKPGDTFVDLGANHGSYSVIASQIVGCKGLVIAFEPQQDLAALVERSLEATRTCDFKVINAGCSDRAGTADFFIPARASGSAGVFAEFSASGEHRSKRIDLTTLDDVMASILVRGTLFLKLDVEGSEFNALIGARKTLQQHRPAILMEVNPLSARASGHSVQELLEMLFEMGYNSICEMEEFPERRNIRDIATEPQRNILLLPS